MGDAVVGAPAFTPEFVEAFRLLFDGRRDVHGQPLPGKTGGRVTEPVTDRVIQDHLEGRRRIGIYTIAGRSFDQCRWGCIDVDIHDWELALLMSRQLVHYGLAPLIEKTKGKGWHVWVIFIAFVPAWKVRSILQIVVNEVPPERLPLEIKATSVEVFPKHDSVPPDGYGNYVNLPLFGGDVPDGRTCFYEADENGQPRKIAGWTPDKVTLSRELVLDELIETGELTLQDVVTRSAGVAVSPAGHPIVYPVPHSKSDSTRTHFKQLLPCIQRVVKEGVGEGARNKWAFRFAIHYKHLGFVEQEVQKIAARWNAEKLQPPMDARELASSVHSAFKPTGQNDSYGCDDPVIAHYCDPECPIYRKDHAPKPENSATAAPPAVDADGVPIKVVLADHDSKAGLFTYVRGDLKYFVKQLDNRGKSGALRGHVRIEYHGNTIYNATTNLDSPRERKIVEREAYEHPDAKHGDKRVTGVAIDLMNISTGVWQVLEAEMKKIKDAESAGRDAYILSEKERYDAEEWAKDHPNLLYEMVRFTSQCGLTREKANRCSVFIIGVSRLMESPTHGIGKGDSSSGKSHLASQIFKLMPEEGLLELTRITPAALFHKGEDALMHSILFVREAPGSEESEHSLRTFMTEKDLTLLTVEKDEATGRHVTREVKVKGPICFYTTTTAVEVNAENETRLFTVPADETEAMSQSIKDVSAYQAQFGSLAATVDELKPWRNFQRLLKKGSAVWIPYADRLTKGFPTEIIRSRRDFARMLEMIKACAFLHQFHRNSGVEKNKDGVDIHVIYASVADYQIVKSIMQESIMRVVLGMKPGQEELLRLLASITETALEDDECYQTQLIAGESPERKPTTHVSVEKQENGEKIVWVESSLLRTSLGKTQAAVTRLIRALESDGTILVSPLKRPLRVRMVSDACALDGVPKLPTIDPEELYELYPGDRKHAYDPIAAPDFADLYGDSESGWKRLQKNEEKAP